MGFIGVILILHPDNGFFKPGSFIALGTGILRSIGYPALRLLSKVDDAQTILFNFFFLGSIVMGLFTIGIGTIA